MLNISFQKMWLPPLFGFIVGCIFEIVAVSINTKHQVRTEIHLNRKLVLLLFGQGYLYVPLTSKQRAIQHPIRHEVAPAVPRRNNPLFGKYFRSFCPR